MDSRPCQRLQGQAQPPAGMTARGREGQKKGWERQKGEPNGSTKGKSLFSVSSPPRAGGGNPSPFRHTCVFVAGIHLKKPKMDAR